MSFISNPQLDLAFDYVRYTNKNIFLTGKAGTGKTTFLHQIKEKAIKRMVVLAPTGVAAINAGGMTIHSFFQLPFGPQVPGASKEANRHRRFSRVKINLIKSLDLVVIDEISMVRADLLDGIDEVLRRYRDFTQPFGGVQLLMIGDLHQLPPVVKDEEWQLLSPYYSTSYFFGSLALQKTRPVVIELKHIFRQSDAAFIELLNKVRNNRMDLEVLETINSRFRENFQPHESENYITLTSHNAAAHDINARKLESIQQPNYIFTAEIKGDFPEHAWPTEERLEVKRGAQVMFIKNDLSAEKLFYNGKIGVVTKIEQGQIYVKCKDSSADIAVSPLDWHNVKYNLNEKNREVEEEIIGTFTQYPLKLAWAITIHKSQGLTFEKAIIDARAAFAHGQVYVALSRCKTFEGIVLRSKINVSSVKTDEEIKTYTAEAYKNAPDEAHLQRSKREYQTNLLLELFSLKTTKKHFDQLKRIFLEHDNALTKHGHERFKALVNTFNNEIVETGEKFMPQLKNYCNQQPLPEDNQVLQERLKKAGVWFSGKLNKELIPELQKLEIVSDNKEVKKNAKETIVNLQKEVFIRNACFICCTNSFSTLEYVRTRTNAELDFEVSKSFVALDAALSRVPADTPNPELFLRLRQWRAETAKENGVELYEVLPTISLIELAKYLPVTGPGLLKIKGIGKYKKELYGDDIIAIIERYCDEKNIPASLMNLTGTDKKQAISAKPDTRALSFELYKSGKSMDEIAVERGLTRGTIEGHLGSFIEKGVLDIFSIMDKKRVEPLIEFFEEHNTRLGSDAKLHFGDDYSFGEIRLVQSYLSFLKGAKSRGA